MLAWYMQCWISLGVGEFSLEETKLTPTEDQKPVRGSHVNPFPKTPEKQAKMLNVT